MGKNYLKQKFEVEKHIIGTESYEINQDIIKGVSEEDLLEKARAGFYKNTAENRRLGRVGKSYGIHKELDRESYSTEDRFKINGKWSRKRVKDVHNRIYDKVMRNAVSSEKPTAVLLMGGTASGKGTATKSFIGDIKQQLGVDLVNLDVDEIKKDIPEYNTFNKTEAASNVHEESSFIGKKIRKTIVNNKVNFINDATFSDKEKAEKLIKYLKSRGYNIRLINVSTDIDEAKRRESGRAERTGRKVPVDILEHSHIDSVDTFNSIKDKVDDYHLIDNNSSTPKIIASKEKGIIDDRAFSNYQNKKNYKRTI